LKYWIFFIPVVAFAQARSGLDYSSEEVRKLQANDAENPGMLWVDRGAALFAKDCASCHRDTKGIAAKYPRREKGQVVTLEQKVKHLKPSMAYESDEMLALTAYLAHESRGLPFKSGISTREIEIGKAEYFRRRGQMNLSCSHCHDANAGKQLGTETISQGQPNGYPAYRLEWQKLGSLQRRLRACMFGLHAELPAYGSTLLNELELYLAWRAKGLPIETPAVRR
jgi:L-cysteine S-thiosulfotransferase